MINRSCNVVGRGLPRKRFVRLTDPDYGRTRSLEELFSREDADAWKLMALRFRLLKPLWDHIGEV